MAGAQFIGKDKLIAAFDKMGGGTWQLAQGKKVCATGEGTDELSEWIDIFAPAGSRSPYTVHLYGDIDPEAITKTTPPLASWDFTMFDTRTDGAGSTISGTAGVVSKLQKQIDDRIAEKIGNLLDKADEPDDEPKIDFIAIVNEYAQNPHKLGQAIGAVNGLVGMLKNLLGGGAPQQPMAAVGSVFPGQQRQNVQQPAAEVTEYPEGTYERLSAVLNTLEKRDPKLLQHLEKLAALDDITFSIILSKLDVL